MGSPLAAMIGLALGFSLVYAGVKNVSFLSVLKGTDTTATPNAQSVTNNNSGTAKPSNTQAQ